MTFEVILYFFLKMRLYIVSIQRNFYQNQFINECARKKKAKIPESRRFLVRYRRTYVLNNYYKICDYACSFLNIRMDRNECRVFSIFSLLVKKNFKTSRDYFSIHGIKSLMR